MKALDTDPLRRCLIVSAVFRHPARRALVAGSFLAAVAVLGAQAPQLPRAPTPNPDPTPAQTSEPPSAVPQTPNADPSASTGDAPVFSTPPIAIVPLDSKISGAASSVTGAMQVWNGRAYLSGSGTITAGANTAQVTLPYRGVLRLCASTTVKLAVDSSVPVGETAGLLMAVDHGAVETSFANVHNADVLMTPDFRILIGGPGSSELKVRLGDGGDTCIDNSGANAPYVVVTSLFDDGIYRVQPGQHVMLQHGSLHDVVDSEKEPCGCPPSPVNTTGNEFPLAQSEGLAPMPAPAPAPPQPGSLSAQATAPLVYAGGGSTPKKAVIPPTDATPPLVVETPTAPPAPVKQKKPGVFRRMGRFFKRVFGAE